MTGSGLPAAEDAHRPNALIIIQVSEYGWSLHSVGIAEGQEQHVLAHFLDEALRTVLEMHQAVHEAEHTEQHDPRGDVV